MNTFGAWLLSELEKRDMSQADLSRASGITTAQISRIISGTRGVGEQALTSIAHALRLPPESVFRAAGFLPPTTEDPWAERMNHKIGQLSGARREMAERLLDTLLNEQDREISKTAPKTAKP